jgi:phosphate starvation-inducible protein PhoH and related proteins
LQGGFKIHLFVGEKQPRISKTLTYQNPLTEKLILLPDINPVELYGVNDSTLELIRTFYPKLKIIARGLELKIQGEESDIESFEQKLSLLIQHQQRYGNLSEQLVKKLMLPGDFVQESEEASAYGNPSADVIVFGNSGVVVKARTPNQRKIVTASFANDMVFAIGPAGTGKTYTAVALAVRALRNKEVKRIILTRPAVEAGENLGFLPGDLKEKLDPYLQPLYDALLDMIPADKLSSFLEAGIIQIAPLAFMRGRTLDNAFVILDEAQNATEAQLKMFLTRMGRSANFLITGDLTQIDLPKNQPSGLANGIKILNGVEGIEIIHLDTSDVIRHKLVTRILHAYQQNQADNESSGRKA